MLYLVRHGQTSFNAEGRLQGQMDILLCEEGVRQSEELAERLATEGPRVRKLYCSTLKRAEQTALIIGRRLNLPPVSVSGIEEIDFGCFQGHRFEECARLFPEKYADYLIKGAESNAYGGETGRQVFERAREAIIKLPEAKEGCALVVCHGAVIGYLRAAAAGAHLNDVKEFIPGNAELIEFTPEMVERIERYGAEQ